MALIGSITEQTTPAAATDLFELETSGGDSRRTTHQNLMRLPNYTVAGLPAVNAANPGRIAYATDGRKSGEAAAQERACPYGMTGRTGRRSTTIRRWRRDSRPRTTRPLIPGISDGAICRSSASYNVKNDEIRRAASELRRDSTRPPPMPWVDASPPRSARSRSRDDGRGSVLALGFHASRLRHPALSLLDAVMARVVAAARC